MKQVVKCIEAGGRIVTHEIELDYGYLNGCYPHRATLAFIAEGTNLTARDAAQHFAETFDPVRTINWLTDGRFYFAEGHRVYKAEPFERGRRIFVVGDYP